MLPCLNRKAIEIFFINSINSLITFFEFEKPFAFKVLCPLIAWGFTLPINMHMWSDLILIYYST